jgi:hypothetical protein
MASPPELTGETAYAGDDYDLTVTIQDQDLDGRTFTAQVRAKPGATGEELAEFDVTAEDGTGDDDGNVVITLHLPGDVVAELPAVVACDLQQDDPPLTLLRWRVVVKQDVTRSGS